MLHRPPLRISGSSSDTCWRAPGSCRTRLSWGGRPSIRCWTTADIVGRLDRGQTTGPVVVMRENLAALFELEQVLVMDAIHNTAKEGATASHSFIGGKHALLCYAAPSPGLMTPSAGYTFSWTGYVGASDNGVRIKRFRMEELGPATASRARWPLSRS